MPSLPCEDTMEMQYKRIGSIVQVANRRTQKRQSGDQGRMCYLWKRDKAIRVNSAKRRLWRWGPVVSDDRPLSALYAGHVPVLGGASPLRGREPLPLSKGKGVS